MRAPLAAALILAAGAALAQPCPPVAVDGDTIATCGERTRLFGIDAPELHQPCFLTTDGYRHSWPCGERAREALAALLREPVSCTPVDRDRYGRAVARCTNAAGDIGEQMVRRGWALDWDRYSHGAYRAAQEDAVGHSRGVWVGDFDFPWVWRQQQRGMR